MPDLNTIRRSGNFVSLVGVVQFLVLSFAAMQFYPGGSPFNSSSDGYHYLENPYSDLGREVAWNGERNIVSRWIFNTAMIVLGVSMLPFFGFLPMHAPDRPILLTAASLFGMASSVSLIGIGMTPYDVHFQSHHLCLVGWVSMLGVAGGIHFIALLLSKECSDFFAFVSLGLVVIIVVYSSWGVDQAMEYLRGGITAETSGVVFRMQKLLVLYCIFWYAVLSLRMVLIPEVKFVPVSERLSADADKYMKRYGRK